MIAGAFARGALFTRGLVVAVMLVGLAGAAGFGAALAGGACG